MQSRPHVRNRLGKAHPLNDFSDPAECPQQDSTEYPSNLTKCKDLHPARHAARGLELSGAALGIMLVGLCAYILGVMVWAPPNRWAFPAVVGAGFLVLILPITAYGVLSSQENFWTQEEFDWLDGVSVWPSLWIRWIALILNLVLLWDGARRISRAIRDAAEHFVLLPWRSDDANAPGARVRRPPLYRRLRKLVRDAAR